MSGYDEPRPLGFGPRAYFDSAEGCWRDAEAEQIEWPGEAPGEPIPDDLLVPWWEWQEGKRPPGWAEPGRSGPRCGVCGERESDPYFWPLDLIAFDSGLIVEACARCWLRWPRAHRRRADDPDRLPGPELLLLSDEEYRRLARLPAAELALLIRDPRRRREYAA